MKAKPVKEVGGKFVSCLPADATDVFLHFPGPIPIRRLRVILKGARDGTPCWSWNGSIDKPTFKPSILSFGGTDGTERCHSFVTDGKVQFLSDCTHAYAGTTLDLLDVDKAHAGGEVGK